MTVAAGFLCEDGIVIAADTQETTVGYMKGERRKIDYYRMDEWSIAVVGSGEASYVDMCVQKVIRQFAREKNSPLPTLAEIEDCALLIFERHFAPLSIYSARERPEVQLLIAVQPTSTRSWSGALIEWSGTSIVCRDRYAFIGAGAQMGSAYAYKLRPPLYHNPRFAVAGVAIYILDQVKATIDTCGGNTDVVVLGRDEPMTVMFSGETVREYEEKYRLIDRRDMHAMGEKIIMESPTPGDF